MTRPRSPLPRSLLIIAVGTLILAGLVGAWIVMGGLVETADPWLRPFVPVLDSVYAMLSGHDCHGAHARQAVGTVSVPPPC